MEILEISHIQFEKLTNILEKDDNGYYLPLYTSGLSFDEKGEISYLELREFSNKLNEILKILNTQAINIFDFKTIPISDEINGEEHLNLYILTNNIIENGYIFFHKIFGICKISDYSEKNDFFNVVSLENKENYSKISVNDHFNVYNYRIV